MAKLWLKSAENCFVLLLIQAAPSQAFFTTAISLAKWCVTRQMKQLSLYRLLPCAVAYTSDAIVDLPKIAIICVVKHCGPGITVSSDKKQFACLCSLLLHSQLTLNTIHLWSPMHRVVQMFISSVRVRSTMKNRSSPWILSSGLWATLAPTASKVLVASTPPS